MSWTTTAKPVRAFLPLTVGVLLTSTSCVLERGGGSGGSDGRWDSCEELLSSDLPPRPGDPCDDTAFEQCCEPDLSCGTWLQRWNCTAGVLQRTSIPADEDPSVLRSWCGAEDPPPSSCRPLRGV